MDYAAEKAAALARRAEREKRALAEADAEFEKWFQERPNHVLNKVFPNQRRNSRALATKPRCWCGKATLALGLCGPHYGAMWELKRGNLRVPKHTTAICHPGEPIHALGLCHNCYKKLPRNKVSQRGLLKQWRIEKSRRDLHDIAENYTGKRTAYNCEHTDRPNKSRGLCGACEKKHRLKGTLHEFPLSKTERCRAWLCPHKTKPHKSRGMCSACYWRYVRNKKLGRVERKKRKYTIGQPLLCGCTYQGPDTAVGGRCKRHYARFQKKRTKKKTRAVYYHPTGAPLLCGCVGKPHYGHGACQTCARYRKITKTPEYMSKLAAIIAQQQRNRLYEPQIVGRGVARAGRFSELPIAS